MDTNWTVWIIHRFRGMKILMGPPILEEMSGICGVGGGCFCPMKYSANASLISSKLKSFRFIRLANDPGEDYDVAHAFDPRSSRTLIHSIHTQ